VPDARLAIGPLEASQIDSAAAVLARAFFDYPIWRWMLPDEGRRHELMPWFMAIAVRAGLRHGEAYAAGDPIAGVAIWELPGRVDADLDDSAAREGDEATYDDVSVRFGEYAMSRFEAMIETQRPIRQRLIGGAPTWYLPWLGVDPAAQRTGVGRALLGDMFSRMDASKTACLLETENEINVAYYEGHGFRVVASGRLPLDGPGFWTMLRDSPAASHST
jgi:ribosomal protein S18 acetylase RimI-like enzyme